MVLKNFISRFVVLSLFCISITFCVNPNIKNISILESNYQKSKTNIHKTIILSNEINAIVGDITSVIITNNKLLILDKMNKRALSVFDLHGKFLWQTKNGDKQNELFMPEGFIVKDNLVHIKDINFIKTFDLDGNFIGIKELPPAIYMHCFDYITETRVISYGAFPKMQERNIQRSSNHHYFEYQIITPDFLMPIDKMINTSSDLLPLVCEHPISNNNGEIFCVSKLSNFIFSVDQNEFSKTYYIDFEAYAIEESDFSQGYRNVINKIIKNQKKGLLDNIYHTNNYLSFSYVNGKEDVVHVICSKGGEFWCDWTEVLYNDSLPNMIPVGITEDNFILSIKPSQLDQNEIHRLINEGLIPEDTNKDSNLIIFIMSVDLQ